METVRIYLEPLRRALHFAVRYWPALLVWGLIGGAGSRLTMMLAARANRWEAIPDGLASVLAFGCVALSMLVQIAATIAMFFALREAMPGLRHLRIMQREADRVVAAVVSAPEPARGRHARRRGIGGMFGFRTETDQSLAPMPVATPDQAVPPPQPETSSDPDEEPDGRDEPTFIDFVIVAAVPFLAFYATWGVIDQYLSDLIYEAMQTWSRVPDQGPEVMYAAAIAAVTCYLLKRILWWLVDKEVPGKRVLRLLAIFFEVSYLFYAVVGLSKLLAAVPEWLHTRVFWVEITQLKENIRGVFAPFDWVVTGIENALVYLPDAKDAFLYPLIWLAITCVIYGHVLDRERDIVANSSVLNQFQHRFNRLPGEVKFLVDHYTSSRRGKWVPLVNALRLVWQAGPLLFLLLAVAMRAMEAGVEWGFVGLTHLIGDRGGAFWVVFRHLIEDLPTLVILILRVCLLAAFFDTILQRIRRRNEPTTDEPEPNEPQRTPAPVG